MSPNGDSAADELLVFIPTIVTQERCCDMKIHPSPRWNFESPRQVQLADAYKCSQFPNSDTNKTIFRYPHNSKEALAVMAEQTWLSLPSQLQPSIPKLNRLLTADEQFLAFSDTEAISKPLTFGWKSVGADKAVLCTVSFRKGVVTIRKASDATFTLCALLQQWENPYQPVPAHFYQSYWGLYGQNIH